MKGAAAGQPFIHHDAQGILIAGGARFPLKLLRGSIRGCACKLLGAQLAGALGDHGHAKIAQEDLLLLAQQQILWLDIAVDEPLLVGVGE